MVRAVQTLLRSQMACNEMQASAEYFQLGSRANILPVKNGLNNYGLCGREATLSSNRLPSELRTCVKVEMVCSRAENSAK